MIAKGDPKISDARADFGYSGNFDLGNDLLRFRCNKAYDATTPISLGDVRGTVTSLQRTCNQSYSSGSTSKSMCRQVQQTKYDPGNIIDSAQTYTDAKSQYHADNYPNGIRMETRVERRGSNADCAIGQQYWGVIPASGGSFEVEFYHNHSSTSSCRTRLEVITWSSGWLKGTSVMHEAVVISSNGLQNKPFSVPSGSGQWLTVILQCIVDEGKYWMHEYIVKTGSLICRQV